MDRYNRTIERRFQTGAEVNLQVHSRNGNVLIRRHDLPEVHVVALVEAHAETEAEAEREFRAVEDGMHASSSGVRVTAPSSERSTFLFFGRGMKVDYEVFTPHATEVTVEARSGRVEVRDIGRDTRVDSRNGSALIENITGDVQVESRNGRIDANDCASEVRLMSRNGNVHVNRAGGNVTAETNNGDVVLQGAGRSARLRSNNGSLRFTGAVRGNLDIEVEGNGSIRLAIPADSRFALDAEAVRGDVNSDLPVREQVPSGELRPTVRLRTINGSIKIEALEAVS